VAEEAMMDVI